MTIWIVMGATGEYSDRSEWFVAAYTSEAEATKHADRAAEAAHAFETAECAHGEKRTEMCEACGRWSYDTEGFRAWMGDLDPKAQRDYTGTNYVSLPVPMREAAPGSRASLDVEGGGDRG